MSNLTILRTKRTRSSGDKLAEAFQEYRDELVGTLSYFLGNEDDAQDVVQETFVKCWRRVKQVPRIRNLRSWIFRVGLNAARDLQRNAYRRKARPLDLVYHEPPYLFSAEDQLIDTEEQLRLRQALRELRAEEKEVFLFRQNADLTYEEIAEITGRPVGTVKTQMRTALIKLKETLSD